MNSCEGSLHLKWVVYTNIHITNGTATKYTVVATTIAFTATSNATSANTTASLCDANTT